MKQSKLSLMQFWKTIAAALIIAALTFVMLFGHLGRAVPRLSGAETSTRSDSLSLRHIADHPINAPLTVAEHFFIKIRPHSVAATRAAAALYGVAALVLFFGILKFWQDTFTAVLGTVVFGTSSWFLHTARLGTPGVLLLGILALIACGLWLKHTLRRNLVVFLCALAAAAALYIPGFIWFIIAGAIWQRRTIRHELNHTKKLSKVLAAALFIVLALPFILAASRHISVVLSCLGLPTQWPAPMEFLKNAYHIPETLFFRAPVSPSHWLGRLPILDVFEDAMFALGLYVFWLYRDLARSRLLFGLSILSIALIILGGGVNVTVLVPLVYFVIAAGILYLLEVWLKVFPRNPVARSLGVIVLVAAIIISCNYQLRRYFVAWPHAPATKAAFTQNASIFDTIKR